MGNYQKVLVRFSMLLPVCGNKVKVIHMLKNFIFIGGQDGIFSVNNTATEYLEFTEIL